MSVEDNIFDFKVKDRLIKECKDKNYLTLFSDPTKNQILLDMITYCSLGNQDEAILNLKTTMEFEEDFEDARMSLPPPPPGPVFFFHARGSMFLYEFWKNCFIQIKVAVQKKEPLPRESFHTVMLREYGRFLNVHNFPSLDAFKQEAWLAVISLKNASEALNNMYKTLMKSDGQNED